MNKTTSEAVSLQVEEQFLYESIVSVMTRLFLPDNMNSYACCYDILGRSDIRGRRATADLRRIFSERNISIEKKRLDMFRLCETDVYMRKKWEHYTRISSVPLSQFCLQESSRISSMRQPSARDSL